MKRVVEAITNHCGLNKHLFDIGYKDDPKCLCGHGDETGFHIVCDCPRFRWIRHSILGKPELSISDLNVQKLDPVALAVFLKKARRFD